MSSEMPVKSLISIDKTSWIDPNVRSRAPDDSFRARTATERPSPTDWQSRRPVGNSNMFPFRMVSPIRREIAAPRRSTAIRPHAFADAGRRLRRGSVRMARIAPTISSDATLRDEHDTATDPSCVALHLEKPPPQFRLAPDPVRSRQDDDRSLRASERGVAQTLVGEAPIGHDVVQASWSCDKNVRSRPCNHLEYASEMYSLLCDTDSTAETVMNGVDDCFAGIRTMLRHGASSASARRKAEVARL
ncbi:hypothetical protein SAMN02799636_05732 [Methylobacterium sp. 275MFSha3.1]|nr:hypothetical protein SAMN02799636_05732 [Methylobacterium sp. 275MFSha3.1]